MTVDNFERFAKAKTNQLVSVFGVAMLTLLSLLFLIVVLNRCTLQDTNRKTEVMWQQRQSGTTNEQLTKEQRK